MVLSVPYNKLDQAESILVKHQVRHAVIGRFTNTHHYTVVHDEHLDHDAIVYGDWGRFPHTAEIAFDIPYSLISDCPLPTLEVIHPSHILMESHWPLITLNEMPNLVADVLGQTDVADQSVANSQYDSTVQGLTVYGPVFGYSLKIPTTYWAGTPVYGKNYAAVFTASFSPWLFEIHPVRATRQMMFRTVGALVLAGVRTQDICLCDNFYTPDRDKFGYYWLVEMVRELCYLSETLATPFISGKDSSAGSTVLPGGTVINVPPSVFLSGLGKLTDCRKLVKNEWQEAGNYLVRIGPKSPSMAGTVVSRVLGHTSFDLDEIDEHQFVDYLSVLESSRDLIQSGTSFRDGGTIVTAIVTALGSKFGVDLRSGTNNYSVWFEEHRGGAIVEVRPQDLPKLPDELQPEVLGMLSPNPPKDGLGDSP